MPPQSRTLPFLRTPLPFRLLATALALSVLLAGVSSVAPPLLQRGRLSEMLIDATSTRIEPILAHAHAGRWPSDGPIPAARPDAEAASRMERRVTTSGIALIKRFPDRPIELRLDRVRSAGDILSWRCVVKAVDGRPLSSLSVPEICRP